MENKKNLEQLLNEKFTRSLLREKIKQLTAAAFNQQNDPSQYDKIAGWFVIRNIPVIFLCDTYKIIDQNIESRLIPIEHEMLLCELNDLQHAMLTEEVRRKHTQIKAILESLGYEICVIMGVYSFSSVNSSVKTE